MTSYKDAGVDVIAGDSASRTAYLAAAKTFASRKGMVGAPVFEEGGYAGLLDMGDYYLVMTDDGTGTKIDVALASGTCTHLGSDLLAMVADDAVCTGAEVIAVSNTIDIAKVDPKVIGDLLEGLSRACSGQKIVIPAGEIAEVPGAVHSATWSATAIGIVAKDRVLTPERIAPGDIILSLREYGARSNGFSLIRKILSEKFGKEWWRQQLPKDLRKRIHEKTNKRTDNCWSDLVLTPSTVYHAAILALVGRYGEPRAVEVKGVAHITGGGIPSKLRRVLTSSKCGAHLTDLWEPALWLQEVASMGKVPTDEYYRTWCMGNGMMVIVDPADVEKSLKILESQGMEAKVAGTVTEDPTIVVHAIDATVQQFA